jgi:mannose-6-phosphate isomerase-like protein (cupin superfamily)
MTFIGRFLLSVVIISIASPNAATAQSKHTKPKACLVQLSDSTTDYQEVLSGPPQTATMQSGLVVLFPSKSVGKHSTKSYEEAVVVFSGTGEMRITGGPTFKLKMNTVAYCPPNTEHDVINTGSGPLRYLYVASKHEH